MTYMDFCLALTKVELDLNTLRMSMELSRQCGDSQEKFQEHILPNVQIKLLEMGMLLTDLGRLKTTIDTQEGDAW